MTKCDMSLTWVSHPAAKQQDFLERGGFLCYLSSLCASCQAAVVVMSWNHMHRRLILFQLPSPQKPGLKPPDVSRQSWGTNSPSRPYQNNSPGYSLVSEMDNASRDPISNPFAPILWKNTASLLLRLVFIFLLSAGAETVLWDQGCGHAERSPCQDAQGSGQLPHGQMCRLRTVGVWCQGSR